MTSKHKYTLRAGLLLLAVSLIIPSLIEIFHTNLTQPVLFNQTVDLLNQYRALHAMMLSLGLISLWACMIVERARMLVIALGIVMLCLVVARSFSLWFDGIPGWNTLAYQLTELLLAALFLRWPPLK